MIPRHLIAGALLVGITFGCQSADSARSHAAPPEPVPRSEATVAADLPTASVAASTQPAHEELAAREQPLEQPLLARASDRPRDLAPQLDSQLARLIRDEPVPDASIASLAPDDRDVLTTLCNGLAQFRANARGGGSVLLTSKIEPLVQMSDRLRARAGLTLPAVFLCKSVSQFGVYEPFAPAQFDAGKETPVILYCEVANFASQRAKDQQWETKLSYEMSMFRENEASMPVIGKKPTNILDRCRNRRHDFFIADRLTLPPSLPPGRYVLKVSIVDQQANRIAEATVPLSILAR